jgi:thiol-disulfide isomerase/thioredoxin
MTDAAPPGPAASRAPEPEPSGPSEIRKPRKRFILIGLGIGILIVGFIGLLTHGASNNPTPGSTSGGQPQPGNTVPAFTAHNVGPVGGSRVAVPSDGGSNGRPAVLLFFGNWCPSCHQELPPLAAAVRQQDEDDGPLSHVRVIGVDSEDTTANAKAFIKSSGVTFPVAYDPNVTITAGTFDFHGDPYTVFVRGDGVIARIVSGDQLTPTSFTADERALIPNGT